MTNQQELRELAETLDACEWCHPLGSAKLCRDAANEIERLRADNDRLVALLSRWVTDVGAGAIRDANIWLVGASGELLKEVKSRDITTQVEEMSDD